MEENVKKQPNTILIVVGSIILIIVAAVYIYKILGVESTDDAYVETTTVQVSPKVSGQLVKVLVEDNQNVKKGDLVAVIEDNDYKIKLAQATAKYNEALQNQKNAQANHSAVKTRIDVAKADFERYKHSYEAGAVSMQEYDVAKAKYDEAKAILTNTQEALITKNGKSVADAQIAELKALKEQAELYLSYTKIYAPQDGTVAGKKASVGMMVQPGTPLLTIVPHNVWIVANFKENQLEKINVAASTFSTSVDKITAYGMANGQAYGELLRQSHLWGYIDTFRWFAFATFMLIPLLVFIKSPKGVKNEH